MLHYPRNPEKNCGFSPFLPPVMVGYFGWPFVLCITGMGFCGSILAGIAVAAIAGEPKLPRGDSADRPSQGAAVQKSEMDDKLDRADRATGK